MLKHTLNHYSHLRSEEEKEDWVQVRNSIESFTRLAT